MFVLFYVRLYIKLKHLGCSGLFHVFEGCPIHTNWVGSTFRWRRPVKRKSGRGVCGSKVTGSCYLKLSENGDGSWRPVYSMTSRHVKSRPDFWKCQVVRDFKKIVYLGRHWRPWGRLKMLTGRDDPSSSWWAVMWKVDQTFGNFRWWGLEKNSVFVKILEVVRPVENVDRSWRPVYFATSCHLRWWCQSTGRQLFRYLYLLLVCDRRIILKR